MTDPLVILMPSGRRGRVQPGQSLLDSARQMGVEIESICGGRLTCGKCRVLVETGEFQKHGIHSREENLTPPDEEELALLERMGKRQGRLSCVACVQGDVLITVPEESLAHKQIIRKSATERVIEIDPAVRQVYIEVEPAELGEHRGDWGRVQAALAEQWDLHNVRIDLPALRELQKSLRKGDWAITVTLWQDEEVIEVRPGYAEGVYGLAVDVGSTTVAGYLCDLRTGELLATESRMNPQVSFGEDLMSRVSYAMTHPDGLEKMHAAIIDTFNQLAASAAREARLNLRKIHDAVVVGNTTMMHIFLGIDPVELGGAPFALANRDAVDVKARELGLRLHPGAYLHVLPAQAGHVGADNVGVLLAENPFKAEELSLIVDVGTNAEIDLGNREWALSASSPTGPAFEGGQISCGMRAAPGAIERVRIDTNNYTARYRVIGEERWSDECAFGLDAPAEQQPRHLAAGICGSGIIEVVVEMFLAGLIGADGRFNSSIDHERVRWDGRKGAYMVANAEQTVSGEPLWVTQDDVRNVQLAKAALYAGAKLLMNRAGVDHVDRVLLAGAFGSYIDPKYAMILGLIPDCDLAVVSAVGNAAGDGARIALLNRHKRAQAQDIAYQVHYIETAVDPEFQAEFVGAMHLPHQSDPYPHLAEILANIPEVAAPKRERKYRRVKE